MDGVLAAEAPQGCEESRPLGCVVGRRVTQQLLPQPRAHEVPEEASRHAGELLVRHGRQVDHELPGLALFVEGPVHRLADLGGQVVEDRRPGQRAQHRRADDFRGGPPQESQRFAHVAERLARQADHDVRVDPQPRLLREANGAAVLLDRGVLAQAAQLLVRSALEAVLHLETAGRLHRGQQPRLGLVDAQTPVPADALVQPAPAQLFTQFDQPLGVGAQRVVLEADALHAEAVDDILDPLRDALRRAEAHARAEHDVPGAEPAAIGAAARRADVRRRRRDVPQQPAVRRGVMVHVEQAVVDLGQGVEILPQRARGRAADAVALAGYDARHVGPGAAVRQFDHRLLALPHHHDVDGRTVRQRSLRQGRRVRPADDRDHVVAADILSEAGDLRGFGDAGRQDGQPHHIRAERLHLVPQRRVGGGPVEVTLGELLLAHVDAHVMPGRLQG